jgi:uncharacterized protein
MARAGPAMLTDALCTQCALCCDGTLLGDVELTGATEAARLQILGLEVDEEELGGELLPLPCAGLCGTQCRIYAHRPASCRQFECRLLRDAQAGVITVPQALTRIEHTKVQVGHVEELLASLEKRPPGLPLRERCTDAIAAAGGRAGGRDSARACEALEAAMDVLEHTVRTTFLDPERGLLSGKPLVGPPRQRSRSPSG